ncbi:MAG: division/cell wall cluster transcriptional repressor MraZ [Bacteroidales bacterium]|nr:division/cell wall cluster transcriptional repressor MraZ [Bacteroidales bacterium]
MSTFIGEISAKIDVKGRVVLPSAFIKQMKETEDKGRFVLRKSIFKNCLELYPFAEWEEFMTKMRTKFNPALNKKHNLFFAQFSRGSVEVEIDGSNRILINKRLSDSVKIDKDLIFVGTGYIIEVWDVEEYEKSAMSDLEFEQMASELIGDDFNF